MPVEQPSSIIPGVDHRVCPCGFARSPPSYTRCCSPDGTLPCPAFAVGNLLLPVTARHGSIMPLRISPFINSFARSPWSHKSQSFNTGKQYMAFNSCQSDVSLATHPIHFVIQIYYITRVLTASSFRSGGGYVPPVVHARVWKLEMGILSSPGSILPAPHFAQTADQVGGWLRARIIYACCH